ncbi:unnamed protein product [Urochloa decumbens]|uniref:Uncharacterized protein n=1 Tax=Urochloa decumbens TaxID=240449 RepID=A0ABC9F2S6_9POAL
MEFIAGDPFTTVSVSSRAYHVLKIDGYSRSSDAFSNIHCIESCPFRAGGHTWIIRFFPKGDNPSNTDFMSFSLVLCDNVDEAVTAEATFSVLDQDQKPVLSCSRTTGMINLSEFHTAGCHNFIKREALEQSKFLNNDCFAIRVDIHIVKKVPSMVVPPSDMHKHLLDLFSSKEGADVELLVGGETFAAHRLVLGARSSVFRADLSVPRKEGITTNVIHIDDLEAPVIRAMLTFMYTDIWPHMDHQDEFAMTQCLLVAAERYNIQRLKILCEDRLCHHIDTRSVVTILALAEKHHCAGLKDACFEFLCSSTTLFAVTKTKKFRCLAQSYPDIIEKLRIFNAIARYREKEKIAGWWSPESQDSVIKIPYNNLSSNAKNSGHCTSIV